MKKRAENGRTEATTPEDGEVLTRELGIPHEALLLTI
jgi:hypothetical protein